MLTRFIEDLYLEQAVDARKLSRCEELLKDCDRQGVSAQVMTLLQKSGQLELLPKQFRDGLEIRIERITGQNLLLQFEQRKILQQLDQQLINIIPIKGTIFAERYFGSFAARGTSDIDFIVHDSDVDRTIQCLRDLGYEGPHRYNPIHFHCVMSKRVHGVGLPLNVEIHWSLMHQNSSRIQMEELWQDSKVMAPYRYVRELSLQSTLYTLCLHGANHGMDALKYSLDIAHLLYWYGDDINLKQLLARARHDGTLRRVYASLSKVYHNFPTLSVQHPLPRPKLLFVAPSGCVLRNSFLALDSWNQRMFHIKSRIWPERTVALWHMRDDPKVTPKNVYLRFYQRRAAGLIKRIAK